MRLHARGSNKAKHGEADGSYRIMQWPKTESGAVDWETAFENPSKGLIPLVIAARTPAKVRKITAVLVGSLLIPGSDPAKRGQYSAALAKILAKDKPAETVQPDAIALLRAIKNDRIAKDSAAGVSAGGAASGGAPNAAPAPSPAPESGGGGSRGEDEPLPSIDELGEDGDDEDGDDEDEDSAGRKTPDPEVVRSAEYTMGAFFLRQYEERLRTLHESVTAEFPSPPPYLVSKQFAARFMVVLANRFVDRVIDANYATVKRCDSQAADKRDEYLEEMFEDMDTRRRFFERWKGIWLEKTEQKPLPKKPKADKQSGVLSMLSGKKSKQAMTIEEWEAAVAEVRADNEAAEAARAEIMAESPDYIAPKDEDMEVLMGLLGRTPVGMEKQITAISQIGLQSRSTAAFDRYQQGRPVDLPLLGASFRHPEAFLGPKGFTRDLMRGYREASRVAAFPLVSRFIVDAKYKVYSPKAKSKRDQEMLSQYDSPGGRGGGGAASTGKEWEPIPEDPEQEKRMPDPKKNENSDREWEAIPDEPND